MRKRCPKCGQWHDDKTAHCITCLMEEQKKLKRSLKTNIKNNDTNSKNI